jgi:hypothetical protein
VVVAEEAGSSDAAVRLVRAAAATEKREKF